MSFQQGLSGLNSSAKQLDVIGNNVANSNTVGFKQSQAQFADMYAVSLSGSGAAQVGTGGKVAAVMQQFTQGNITNTSNPLDTAVSGQGFFRMVDPNGAVFYSRNGQFQVDKNGFIVNNQGYQLSGYLPDATGNIIPGQPLPIQLNSADVAPKQTASVVVGVNLDAREATPTNPTFSPLDPTSYNRSTSTTVYDSLGVNHVGSLYFQRQPISGAALGNFSLPAAAGGSTTMTTTGTTAGLSAGNTVTLAGVTYTIASVDSATQLTVSPPGPAGGVVAAALTATNAPSPNWDVYLTVDGALVPAVGGTPVTQLSFNSLGQLTAPVGPPLGQVASATFTPTGASSQAVTLDFAQTSQYGGIFSVNNLAQDGYASGRLSKFNTSADGTILGSYTNGQSRALGQILLANFTNPQGLQPMGNNVWVESAASGGPLIGTPGSSSLGVLQSSAVEESNVDLTAELVNMITAQRVYQANAQTIKTQDAVLQTLVNLR